MADPRTRLIVIFGGRSAEHDVSRVTAAHVLAATDPARYEVVPVGITREGQWVLATEAARALDTGGALPRALEAAGAPVDPLPALTGGDGSSPLPADPEQPVVVFPLMHGPLGEDGTVQGMLELADLPYVGSGVLSSALSMDKAVAKELLAHHGVPQCRWHARRGHQITATTPQDLADEFGLPLFVKPANMGSSVGVTKAHDLDELRAGIETALGYDEWVIAEEAVVGREIEVAVLGGLDPRASVPGEIRPGREFYDYEDKYETDGAELLVPAPLDADVAAEVQALALRVFSLLRCDGMARVDFFYEERGRGFLLNEVNTIPGFTPISMYPKLWAASGVPYADLIDELVRLALERHARHRRNTKH